MFYSRLMIVLLLLVAFSGACRRVDQPVGAEDRSPKKKHSQKNSPKGPYEAAIWHSDAITDLAMILQDYLGYPYVGSSEYQVGIDCSRFTAEVYKKFSGFRLPRVSRDQATVGTEISRRRIHYGDLVFFDITGNGVSHVGIYVGDDRFIHASSSRGVVIDKLTERYWKKSYHSARRIIGTAQKNK